MIHTDEDALVCDMAETYGILDFYKLPVSLMATLCTGLRDNSRIVQKISGSKLSTSEALLSMMTDNLNWLCWAKTEDAQKGKNKPQSIYDTLMGITREKKDKINDVITFDSVDDFESALKKAKEGQSWQTEGQQ